MRHKKYIGAAAVAVILLLALMVAAKSDYNEPKVTDASITNTYTACGCGACGGTTPREEIVTSKKRFEELKKADQQLKNNRSLCAKAGCSLCTKYILMI